MKDSSTDLKHHKYTSVLFVLCSRSTYLNHPYCCYGAILFLYNEDHLRSFPIIRNALLQRSCLLTIHTIKYCCINTDLASLLQFRSTVTGSIRFQQLSRITVIVCNITEEKNGSNMSNLQNMAFKNLCMFFISPLLVTGEDGKTLS